MLCLRLLLLEEMMLYPMPDPDIILLDEPLLGLDPHAIKELIDEKREKMK